MAKKYPTSDAVEAYLDRAIVRIPETPETVERRQRSLVASLKLQGGKRFESVQLILGGFRPAYTQQLLNPLLNAGEVVEVDGLYYHCSSVIPNDRRSVAALARTAAQLVENPCNRCGLVAQQRARESWWGDRIDAAIRVYQRVGKVPTARQLAKATDAPLEFVQEYMMRNPAESVEKVAG